MEKTKSRVYDSVNSLMPASYYNYEDMVFTWNSINNYEIIKKIGQGKYSEVFLGIDIRDSKRCVIKVLKPTRQSKFNREISILRNLQEGDFIIKLLDIVKNNQTKYPAIITNYIENLEYRKLYPSFSLSDIKYYCFKILHALDYCHSLGVMHRDIKPQNIMIDHNKREVAIIDWGLAEYYHPSTNDYHVRVASRHYKGPELLVNYPYYDYSLDLWSFGCTFAAMIFKIDILFCGIDNDDQLVKIIDVVGTADYNEYVRKYKIPKPKNFLDKPKKSWRSFVNDKNKAFAVDCALDLLGKLLVFDHMGRITAKEAMKHVFFDEVRSIILEEIR